MKAKTPTGCAQQIYSNLFNPETIRPSPLATPQPPHPPTAPEAASRRRRHGCGATPSRACRVHHAARATRHWELAATQWTEFESNSQSSTSPEESCARLPAGLQLHRHLWCLCQSTWSDQERTVGIYRPPGRWHTEKGTFMPSKPQSSKNLAFVGGRPYCHLDGAKCKIYHKPQKILAWSKEV